MKKIILTALLVYSNYLNAAGTELFTPTYVGCFPSGTCYIGITPNATLTSCASTEQIRFDIALPGSNAQYSAALAALMAGKKIKVLITDTCISDFPIPSYLHVVN